MFAVMSLLVNRFQRQAGNLPTVTGVVTSENMIVLPEGAIMRVALVDVTLPDSPSLTVREQNLQHNGKLPTEFELVYEEKGIDPQKSYQVQATITNAAGQVLFETLNPTPVLTQGHPSKDLRIFVQEIGDPAVLTAGSTADISSSGAPLESGASAQAQPTSAPLPGQNILTGILTYSEDLLLPAGAVAEVRLVDVTIEEAPELEIQKVVIPNPGQKPIPFGVPYYPSTIIDTRSYALRAEVRDQNGDIMFVNSVDYPVITQGRPVQGITLLLEYVVKGMIVSPFDRVH
jgi:uncharacterized lipoprotein YbaY